MSGDTCISLCTAVSTEGTHWFLNLQTHDFTSALSQDCIRRELLALQGPSCSVLPVLRSLWERALCSCRVSLVRELV